MKLRYYLRGLGIGILVTAFIMGVVGSPKREMSDAEIRARAAQLGMIDPDAQVLSNLSQSSQDPTETLPEGGENDDQNEPVPTSSDDSAQASGDGSGQNDAEPDISGSEDYQTNALSSAPNPSTEPDEADGVDVADATSEPDESENLPEASTAETVRFTIRGGSGSESISRDLAAAGLVESASAYDAFLCDNGYSQRLRSGTFDIPVGASYEEIAKMITGG
ncbi:MAG: hypothetical protein NC417_03360 [Candidatus Gastranaerophilales bacterium]|nr:hypothetical protein [Candidatus Gastranaerophilales bacterium]